MRTRLVGFTILLLVACAACVPAPTPATVQAPLPTAAPTLAPQATEAPKPTQAPTQTPVQAQAPTQAPTTAAPAESGALTITPENPVVAVLGRVILDVSPPDPSCKWTLDSLAGTLSATTGTSVAVRGGYQSDVKVTATCDSGTASTIVQIR